MSRLKVLFGAGDYGKKALKYYGEENIAFFVDNDSSKSGKTLLGKMIRDFEAAREELNQYELVITSSFYKEISRQLTRNGVIDFQIYHPTCTKQIDRYCMIMKENQVHSIYVYGRDCFLNTIIGAIRQKLGENFVKGVVTADDGTVGFLKANADCVVVGDCELAIALEQRLKRLLADTDILVINPFKQQAYYDYDEVVYPVNNKVKNEGYDEVRWNTMLEKNLYKYSINAYVEEAIKKVPIFEHIEIETINRCNGVCEFCPVNVHDDSRVRKEMEEGLFHKIIQELEEMDYHGRLATFSNNEPFLDKRIIEWNKYARDHLPNARIHLFTNGTLLSMERFIEIIPFLDELIIDNYTKDLRLLKNCEDIVDYCEKHAELKSKVTIVPRSPEEIRTTRGGDAPNRKDKKSFADIGCIYPFQQLIIRPDGKVSLCCNDALGRSTMGDVNEESLTGIWYGEKFQGVREQLLKGRGAVSHCVYCDTFNLF